MSDEPPDDRRDMLGALEREKVSGEALSKVTCTAKYLCASFPENPLDCAYKNGAAAKGCWNFKDEEVLIIDPSKIVCEHAALGKQNQCHFSGRRSTCNQLNGYEQCLMTVNGELCGAYSGVSNAL